MAMFSTLLVSAVAVSDESWEAWKQEYGRVYNSVTEDEFRRSVFENNLKEADKLQSENPLAEFGSTQFSDWTEEEFNGLLGYRPSQDELPLAPALNLTSEVPDSIDWTGKATTAVKDQGRCGSCWAFSATEQIESMYALKTGDFLQLAPQELVDCKGDKSQRNGCNGGDPMAAYKVIQQLGGQELEKDYPYKATNQRCSFSASKAVVTVSNGQLVGRRNEKEMLNFVGSTGPLSICHDAASWSSYKGGIMTSCRSGGGHCTQIVGYGSENGQNYWKVRNSWGSRFGESGHARLIRDKNLCGLNQHASTVDVTAVGSTATLV